MQINSLFQYFLKHKFIFFLCVFITIYTALLSTAIYLQYRHFVLIQDFSDYLLVIWNTSRGDIFGHHKLWCLEIEKTNFLSGHLSPILLLYALVYRIINQPIILFVIQIFTVGLTSIPLYYIAKAKFHNNLAAFMLGASFLLYQPSMSAAATSLQPETLCMPLIAWAFLNFEKQRYKRCIFFLVFLLFLKENLALIVSTFGLYIFFKRKEKLGLSLFILGVLWFLLFFKIISPLFQEGNIPRFEQWYGHLGNDLFQIIKNLLFHPIISIQKGLAPYWNMKVGMQWQLLYPLLYLPLLSPRILFIALPIIAQIFLSRNHFMPYWLCYYHASIDPILFISAIYGIRSVSNTVSVIPNFLKAKFGTQKLESLKAQKTFDIKKYIVLLLALIILLINLYIAVFQSQFFVIKRDNQKIVIKRNPIYIPSQRDKFIWDVIKTYPIPKEASIATTFPYDQVFIASKRCSLVYYYKHECPDYIFLDALNDRFGADYQYLCAQYLEEILNDPWYELMFEKHGIYIFRRKPFIPSDNFLKELNNFTLKRNLN